MNEAQAMFLASFDRNYFSKQIRGNWIVWDSVSDHEVTFELNARESEKLQKLA